MQSFLRLGIALLFGALLAGCAAGLSRADQPAAPAATAGDVLIFSRTTGFRHASIAVAIPALEQMLRARGMNPVASEDPAIFEGDLSRFRAVILLSNTTLARDAATGATVSSSEHLTGAVAQRFQAWLRGGGALVGIHAASDSHVSQPWYGAMIGGWFERHPRGARSGWLTVRDRNHPAVAGWPAEVRLTDEWYVFRDFDPSVNVILSLDPASIGEPAGLAWPVAWSREDGQGRVFYTGMGHTIESYSDPAFLAHVGGGLDWAMRRNAR